MSAADRKDRYMLRTWIWDAHGHQRRSDDMGLVVSFPDIETATAIGELRSTWHHIAIIELFDHDKGKIVKVWVRRRG